MNGTADTADLLSGIFDARQRESEREKLRRDDEARLYQVLSLPSPIAVGNNLGV